MSKESDKKDAAAQDKADAAQDKADAKDKAAADKFAADESAAGVEHVTRRPAPVVSKNAGKYDLACCTNALNNVLNLRVVPGLDKAGLVAEFEAQLLEILDASSVAPDAWNKAVTRDSQESGSVFQGHPA